MTKMTTEEAFIKVLQMHGIENAFGIIGSAFMPISDLFPKAGITFWDVAHETNGGLIADGYTRATGKMSMVIAQNGPGITGLVTPIKTAYWNHTPLLLVTPQAANKTMGQGGFQEVEQMNLFKDMVCYQEEVRDPSRMAEVLNRVIEKAIRGSAPAQINIPRDYWTHVIDIELPPIVRFERQGGGKESINRAAKILSEAKFPVILSGAGVVIGNAIEECKQLAEKLDAPVCNGYQHNDSFPGKHPLALGPLGYNGSKAAMEIISKADVVLALGTRLNPFSTLPCYGIEYWPKNATVIQVDMNPDRIGLTKKVTVGIVDGDIRFTSGSHLSTSAIALTAGSSGGSNTTNLFDGTNQIARFPAKVETAVAAKLPDDTLLDRVTYEERPNISSIMYDDGNGNLMGAGSGSINYETGAVDFTAMSNAEFVISATYLSAHSGGTNVSTTNGHNHLTVVGARSTNQKLNARIKVIAMN